MDSVTALIVVMSQVYAYLSTHWVVYIKYIWFSECQSYLNKVVFKKSKKDHEKHWALQVIFKTNFNFWPFKSLSWKMKWALIIISLLSSWLTSSIVCFILSVFFTLILFGSHNSHNSFLLVLYLSGYRFHYHSLSSYPNSLFGFMSDFQDLVINSL